MLKVVWTAIYTRGDTRDGGGRAGGYRHLHLLLKLLLLQLQLLPLLT